MGIIFCKCCGAHRSSISSVEVLPEQYLKVLLLGLTGSGKTEVAHVLSNKQRLNYSPTNGVQYYQMDLAQLQAVKMSITEIGGNSDMCKIWHHYYSKSMGIIYCFDMSANYTELSAAFQLLRHTLTHPFVRGKPVLLVGTKAHCIDEGLQLYDFENVFRLDALAHYYASSIRLCYYEVKQATQRNKEHFQLSITESQTLFAGIRWLVNYLRQNYEVIKKRLTYDTNMKFFQERTQNIFSRTKRLRNFRRKRGSANFFSSKIFGSRSNRPQTAPSTIYTLTQEDNQSEI